MIFLINSTLNLPVSDVQIRHVQSLFAIIYLIIQPPEESSIICNNDNIKLLGIHPEAHDYVTNGRTPLEWYFDRFLIRIDKKSGIVDDLNNYFA